MLRRFVVSSFRRFVTAEMRVMHTPIAHDFLWCCHVMMQGGDSSMSQLLYELCFCLWSVSLCEEARHDFMSCGAVPILAQQVMIQSAGTSFFSTAGWCCH